MPTRNNRAHDTINNDAKRFAQYHRMRNGRRMDNARQNRLLQRGRLPQRMSRHARSHAPADKRNLILINGLPVQ
jgi:hypothetical protein